MTTLPKEFPNEIWLEIFEHTERADLLSISRVSKLWHSVVERMLHSTFDAKWQQGEQSWVMVDVYESYIQRLAQAPELLQHLKHASFTACWSWGTMDPSVLSLSPWMNAQFFSASQIKGLGDLRVEACTQGPSELHCMVAFFLHLFSATNIEPLAIYGYIPTKHDWVDAVISYAGNTNASSSSAIGFKNLRQVRLVTESQLGRIDATQLRPYLRIGTLERLILHNITHFSGTQEIYSASYLELPNCLLSNDDLKRFLGCFPRLMILSLRVPHTSSALVSGIVDQITKLGETLKELIIDKEDDYGTLPLLDLTHLTQFRVLKHFTADVRSILGHSTPQGVSGNYEKDLGAIMEALPSSIQTLVFTHSLASLVELLPSILLQTAKSLPQLGELTLDLRHYERATTQMAKNYHVMAEIDRPTRSRVAYSRMANGVKVFIINDDTLYEDKRYEARCARKRRPKP